MILSNNTIQRRSWSEPLDFDLCVHEMYYERRIPFAHRVKPRTGPRSHSEYTTFHQFSSLPIELQQHILYFCDNATLFQLTHVSCTRREAMKLFWSDPNIWYSIDINWLYLGGYIGETYCDLDLLPYVRQVEFTFTDMYCSTWTAGASLERPETNSDHSSNHETTTGATDEELLGIRESIRGFWRRLQRLCPHITHVLVSTTSSANESWYSSQYHLGDFLEACPASILISVSLVEEGKLLSPIYGPYSYTGRSLWQSVGRHTTDAIGAVKKWNKVLDEWEPQIVLLPPKKYFRGPVGVFQHQKYKSNRYFMQRRAARILTVDSVERQHFHNTYNPFTCFTPGCGLEFDQPGQYSRHATWKMHRGDAKLPENMRILFEENDRRLDGMFQELQVYKPFNLDISDDFQINEVSDEEPWDEDQAMIHAMEDETMRRAESFERPRLLDEREADAARAFLYQLEHDPWYAVSQPANKSRLYDSFVGYLFDFKVGRGEDA